MAKFGIVGGGFVGQASRSVGPKTILIVKRYLLENDNTVVHVADLLPERQHPVGTTLVRNAPF